MTAHRLPSRRRRARAHLHRSRSLLRRRGGGGHRQDDRAGGAHHQRPRLGPRRRHHRQDRRRDLHREGRGRVEAAPARGARVGAPARGRRPARAAGAGAAGSGRGAGQHDPRLLCGPAARAPRRGLHRPAVPGPDRRPRLAPLRPGVRCAGCRISWATPATACGGACGGRRAATSARTSTRTARWSDSTCRQGAARVARPSAPWRADPFDREGRSGAWWISSPRSRRCRRGRRGTKTSSTSTRRARARGLRRSPMAWCPPRTWTVWRRCWSTCITMRALPNRARAAAPATANARRVRPSGMHDSGCMTRWATSNARANADLAAALQGDLQTSIERYDALKAAEGALDFVDLLLRARELLRDDAEVRRTFRAASVPSVRRRVPGYGSAAGRDRRAPFRRAGRRSGRLGRLAQCHPEAGRALHRRRPEAVDLSLSPCRHRDVSGRVRLAGGPGGRTCDVDDEFSIDARHSAGRQRGICAADERRRGDAAARICRLSPSRDDHPGSRRSWPCRCRVRMARGT